MTARIPLPSFGALPGYHPPMPELIPDGIDKVLERRWDAALLAEHAYTRTCQPYDVVRRQAEFERRLDAIAKRRAEA